MDIQTMDTQTTGSLTADMDLLKKLSETAGVPGREERVRELLKAELAGVVDTLQEDALGNLVALQIGRRGRETRDALCAHGRNRLLRQAH